MLSPDRLLTEQTYPTLLRTPGRYGFPNERILPGRVSEYFIGKAHLGWMRVATSQGGLVYFGLGPVSTVQPTAPF